MSYPADAIGHHLDFQWMDYEGYFQRVATCTACDFLVAAPGTSYGRGRQLHSEHHQALLAMLAAVDAEHNIRLLPSDQAKTHARRDEWRTECSCGWAGPPAAGQVAAAEHWLAHLREVLAQ